MSTVPGKVETNLKTGTKIGKETFLVLSQPGYFYLSFPFCDQLYAKASKSCLQIQILSLKTEIFLSKYFHKNFLLMTLMTLRQRDNKHYISRREFQNSSMTDSHKKSKP